MSSQEEDTRKRRGGRKAARGRKKQNKSRASRVNPRDNKRFSPALAIKMIAKEMMKGSGKDLATVSAKILKDAKPGPEIGTPRSASGIEVWQYGKYLTLQGVRVLMIEIASLWEIDVKNGKDYSRLTGMASLLYGENNTFSVHADLVEKPRAASAAKTKRSRQETNKAFLDTFTSGRSMIPKSSPEEGKDDEAGAEAPESLHAISIDCMFECYAPVIAGILREAAIQTVEAYAGPSTEKLLQPPTAFGFRNFPFALTPLEGAISGSRDRLAFAIPLCGERKMVGGESIAVPGSSKTIKFLQRLSLRRFYIRLAEWMSDNPFKGVDDNGDDYDVHASGMTTQNLSNEWAIAVYNDYNNNKNEACVLDTLMTVQDAAITDMAGYFEPFDLDAANQGLLETICFRKITQVVRLMLAYTEKHGMFPFKGVSNGQQPIATTIEFSNRMLRNMKGKFPKVASSGTPNWEEEYSDLSGLPSYKKRRANGQIERRTFECVKFYPSRAEQIEKAQARLVEKDKRTERILEASKIYGGSSIREMMNLARAASSRTSKTSDPPSIIATAKGGTRADVKPTKEPDIESGAAADAPMEQRTKRVRQPRKPKLTDLIRPSKTTKGGRGGGRGAGGGGKSGKARTPKNPSN